MVAIWQLFYFSLGNTKGDQQLITILDAIDKTLIFIEMETITLFNLSNLCRTCLSHANITKNLFENTNRDIFDILIAVTQFEIVRSDVLPHFICRDCEQKLNMICEFKTRCQTTNEILQKCISDNFDSKVDVEDSKIDIINSSEELVQSQYVTNQISKDDDGDDTHDIGDIDNIEEKKKKSKQVLRLEQFPYSEVKAVIEKLRKKYFTDKNCTKCPFRGSNGRALSMHMMHVHKDSKDKWCSICNAEFDELSEHMKTHDPNDDLTCQFCKKVFTGKGHLTEHLLAHSNVRPFQCDVCEKCFISSRHLKIHQQTHSKIDSKCKRVQSTTDVYPKNTEFVYECSGCNITFTEHKELDEHLCSFKLLHEEKVPASSHDDNDTIREPQNYCALCSRKVRSLNDHKRKFHMKGRTKSIPEGKLCTDCGKKFKTSSKLRVHMRIHTGEAPYTCKFCGKRHYTRNHLIIHERTHTGERPYVCYVCKKAFAQSSVLSTHMKLHTGRPEMCKICGQRFCRMAELKLHMRRHTGEKPFNCTECGQAFIQRSHLMIHLRIHSGERPYNCPYCARAFSQRSSLNTHIDIHLGNKPFRCDQCPYACRQSYSLKQHMKIHGVRAVSDNIDP